MVTLSSNLSLTEFLQLPETKPASEYIEQKIYQKPMPQGKHNRSVMIFQPNQLPEVKYNNDKLTVLNVLGDWQITPADIFNWLKIK
ncbi:MAG: Uma2 family endonuclease [Nostoc sp. GBBB01]|nr:Uma2 family endonuclease [Nostoc sp. GBBB01]